MAELNPDMGHDFGYADIGHGEWSYSSLVEMEAVLAYGWLVGNASWTSVLSPLGSWDWRSPTVEARSAHRHSAGL